MSLPQSKDTRARNGRACDECRRRRVRCDGACRPNNECTRCTETLKIPCTYLTKPNKRWPSPEPSIHVQGLEARLEQLETLIKTIRPDIDLTRELLNIDSPERPHSPQPATLTVMASPAVVSSLAPKIWMPGSELARGAATVTVATTLGALASINVSASTSLAMGHEFQEDLPSNMDLLTPDSPNFPLLAAGLPPLDENSVELGLEKSLRDMDIKPDPTDFLAPALINLHLLGLTTVTDALELKGTFTHGAPFLGANEMLPHRREEFWKLPDWELSYHAQERSHYSFPERPLLEQLVDLYFIHFNNFFPLLHRPTFERSIANGLHLNKQSRFGGVLLLVLALGSKFSEDSRAFLKEAGCSPGSAGWQWFKQVELVHTAVLAPTSVYELQLYALTTTYLMTTSIQKNSWIVLGVGIRLAQDVGAHRRKAYIKLPTAEAELWKRSMWILLSFDRIFSSALGRPQALLNDDHDMALPIDVDDEYWDSGFQQPPNKPSKIAYFIAQLKLSQISSLALRSLYSLRKNNSLEGIPGSASKEDVVAALDSVLNRWKEESFPEHLRSASSQAGLAAEQSKSLLCSYYHLQIMVHRSLHSLKIAKSSLEASHSICVNAARACIQLHANPPEYDNQTPNYHLGHRPTDLVSDTIENTAIFQAALILMLDFPQNSPTPDTHPYTEGINQAMDYCKRHEERWHIPGLIRDMLYNFMIQRKLPITMVPPVDRGEDFIPVAVPESAGEDIDPAPAVFGDAGDSMDAWFHPPWNWRLMQDEDPGYHASQGSSSYSMMTTEP